MATTIHNGPYDPMEDPIFDGIPDEIRRLLASDPPDLTDDMAELVELALRASAQTAEIPVEIWARELAESMCDSATAYDRQFTRNEP